MNTTYSDSTGEFAFGDVPEGSYYLRLKARVQHPDGPEFQIVDGQLALYVIEVPIQVSAEQDRFEVQLSVGDRVAGLFNMLDVFHSATDFVSAVSDGSVTVNDLTARWQWGLSPGSYTCDISHPNCHTNLSILSDPYQSGDTDEFDDDVLLHEFAHHLEIGLGISESPGGYHSLRSTDLDLRLSWSEGMASAFAASVKKWLREHDPYRLSVPITQGFDLTDFYIDTAGNRNAVTLDLRQASPTTYRYASNEVAVASSLLALQNETDAERVWPTFWHYFLTNQTAKTLEAFWDGMVGYHSPSTEALAAWQTLLAQRAIFYQSDEAETNQSIASSKPVSIDRHSLYRNHITRDEDWHRLEVVSGQRYRIETYDLTNGADTFIQLFTNDGTLISENDDTFDCSETAQGCVPLHNGLNFASSIEHTATETGSLYVRVTTSNAVYDDADLFGYIARYGSYRLRMIEI
ncbi:PPC domain-containing protein [Reinekea blandensis]|uniref:PPC domain-containing protein n=1 Tax=Reinekea blandensis TaxID=374838 RepID=UPI001375B3D3|nr:PPC domain-containing protein [Reinekea blandensis]